MKYFLSLIFLAASFSSFGFVDLKEDLYKKISAGQISLSYTEARVKMFNEIYLQQDADGYFIIGAYCSEKFYHYKKGESVGRKIPDAKFMNTEHTWPQSKFNRAMGEEIQKTDLHHLFPSFSKINSERGNYPFAEVKAGPPLSCIDSHLGKSERTGNGTYFEPSDDHKGNVARAMFYFSVRYKLSIDPVQEYYFRQWHILDPVDAAEKTRHEMISKIQKNRNPFIDDAGLANQILDF